MNKRLTITFHAQYDEGTNRGTFTLKEGDEEVGHGYCSDNGYIHSVRVKDNRQNEGLGTWMMAEIVASMMERDMRHITLDTGRTNLRAQHVYDKIGFVPLRGQSPDSFSVDMIYVGNERYAVYVRKTYKARVFASAAKALVSGQRVALHGVSVRE